MISDKTAPNPICTSFLNKEKLTDYLSHGSSCINYIEIEVFYPNYIYFEFFCDINQLAPCGCHKITAVLTQ